MRIAIIFIIVIVEETVSLQRLDFYVTIRCIVTEKFKSITYTEEDDLTGCDD